MGKFIIILLSLGFGIGIWVQSRTNAALHGEQNHLRAQSTELARLKEMQKQLQTALADSDNLEKLKADAEKTKRLREQIEKNKATFAKVSALGSPPPANAAVDLSTHWRNAGQGTPADTLRSVIWAATSGDVDALTPMLAFDSETRATAETFLQSQTDAIRSQYPTIEKLVATIMSGSISTGLGKADLLKHTEFGSDQVAATFTLQSVSKGGATPLVSTRNVTFRFQKTGDAWRLLVPASAIEGYRHMLKQP